MKDGIICIETEWEDTTKGNRRAVHTKALLDFLAKTEGCKVIYKTIATKAELAFYLKRFNLKQYKDYSTFYLSFHGAPGTIQLEGERELLSLDALTESASGAFEGRNVHFSSCRTLRGDEAELLKFKEENGILLLSGYTRKVDVADSAIHDLAYFDQLLRHPVRRAQTRDAMAKFFSELGKKLGFKIL